MSVQLSLSLDKNKVYRQNDVVPLLMELEVREKLLLRHLYLVFEGICTVTAPSDDKLIMPRKEIKTFNKITSLREYEKSFVLRRQAIISRSKTFRPGNYSIEYNFRLPAAETYCKRQDILPRSTCHVKERDSGYLLPPTFRYVGEDGERIDITYKLTPIVSSVHGNIEGELVCLNYFAYPCTISPFLMPAFDRSHDQMSLDCQNQSIVQSQWHSPFPIYTHSQTIGLGVYFYPENCVDIGRLSTNRVLVSGKQLSQFVNYTLMMSVPKIDPALQNITSITKKPDSILVTIQELKISLLRVLRFTTKTRMICEGSIETMQTNNKEFCVSKTVKDLTSITDGRSLLLQGKRIGNGNTSTGEIKYVAELPLDWLYGVIPEVEPAFCTSEVSLEYYLVTDLRCMTLSGLQPIHLKLDSLVLVGRQNNQYRL